MRDSIPTHYALIGAALMLAAGFFIGTQFATVSVPLASNHGERSDVQAGRISPTRLPQTLADNKSERLLDDDTRAIAGNPMADPEPDPASALANAFEQSKGLELEQKVLTLIDHWAAKDSKAAFDWLESHSDELGANLPDLYSVIMSHHIRQAPESSKWTISEMKPSALKSTLAAQLAQTLADTDPLQALQWSTSLSGEEARNTAIEAAIQSYAEKDLEAAMEFAMGVSDPAVQQQIFFDVGFVMASVDPTKASNAMESFPAEVRSRLIPRLAWSMSQKDPEQTIDWLAQLPEGSTRDNAIREATWGLVSASPENAFRLASTVGDSATRYGLIRDALIAWHKVDAGSAQQALETQSDLSESQKDLLLQDLQQNASAPDLVAPY